MGRKRNQGKARKAAAKAKAEQEVEENGPGQILAAQMQMQLWKCCHRVDPSSASVKVDDVSFRFAAAFRKSFRESYRDGDRGLSLSECLIDARYATMDEFEDVWKDYVKMESVMSFLLSNGAQLILEGNYDYARQIATYARFIEQHIAIELKQSKALYNFPKILEGYKADMHTLVKFFRRRISCSCLDKRYEEVKNITKIAFCYNPRCTCLPYVEMTRSRTMYCSRCRCVTYCSRGCQKADWSRHKSACDKCFDIKADFEAEQQQSV